MKKKILLISFFILILMFNFGFFVLGDPIDINDITDKNFYLINANKIGDINKNYTLKLGFDSKMALTYKDVSYKLVGSESDIVNFTRCVDVKINVETGYFEFIGDVKRWGEYSIDIQPIIKDVLTLDKYVWWNSTWLYNSGSCITDNITNYAMKINITYDNPDGWLDCEGLCQTNFSDIRFVTEDNTTELYHWIEYYENSNYAWFWVNVSDEDFINVYFGRDTAIGNSTYNSGINTFYMFEDFTSITDWTNYAGGGFSVSGGLMTATSSASYRYMYKDIPTDDYLMKCSSNGFDGATSGFISVNLDNDLDTASWTFEANEHILAYNGDMWVWNTGYNSISVTYPATYPLPDYNQWMKAYIEYNGDVKVNKHNNFNLASNIVVGATSEPTYVIFKIRNIPSVQVKFDWLFIGYHNITEPSFCSWYDKISYCQYNNRFVNESPADSSMVSGINVSYITGELLILDDEADSINISLVADNGLFYINDTTDVINGTYSLNVMLANFTDGNTYVYYVNITNGDCFVSYDFSFETVYFGGYTEFQILSYKMNMMYEDMIKGEDEMNITVDIEVTLLFILLVLAIWLFFITKYYDTRNTMFCILQFGVSIPLFIIIASISLSYPFGFVLVFAIPVISLYIFIDGIIYGKKKQKEKR